MSLPCRFVISGINQAHFSSCASFRIAAFCVARLISFERQERGKGKKDKQAVSPPVRIIIWFLLGKSRLGNRLSNFISPAQMQPRLLCFDFEFEINADLVFDILKLNFRV